MKKHSFTLIELLVVIAMITILPVQNFWPLLLSFS